VNLRPGRNCSTLRGTSVANGSQARQKDSPHRATEKKPEQMDFSIGPTGGGLSRHERTAGRLSRGHDPRGFDHRRPGLDAAAGGGICRSRCRNGGRSDGTHTERGGSRQAQHIHRRRSGGIGPGAADHRLLCRFNCRCIPDRQLAHPEAGQHLHLGRHQRGDRRGGGNRREARRRSQQAP
jgi:hypothetical protein